MSDLEELKKLVLQDAAERRLNAGMGGSHDDGGASRLEEQVKFYEYGQRCVVPPEWTSVAHRIDPEWPEHLRLMKKFGDRR